MATSLLRTHLLSRVAFLAAIGGIGTGCGGDDTNDGTSLPDPSTLSACGERFHSEALPVESLEIGLGGAPIEIAGDRIRIAFAAASDLGVDALRGALDPDSMCMDGVDLERGRATVRLSGDTDLANAMRQLATIPLISGISVDPVVRGMHGNGHGNGHDDDEDEPETPSMWHLAALRLGAGLKIQPDANGVVVALLDTGVTAAGAFGEAPGLGSTPILPGHDYINNDADAADDNGHGTLLAGILASDGDYPGVAQGVSILPVKVLDQDRMGTESALVDGLHFAIAQDVDIISMSLSFPPGYIPSYEMADAIHRAHDAGIVVVAATGNHGSGEIGYPAAFGEVLAVGGGRMAKKFKSVDAEKALKVSSRKYASKVRKADYSGWGSGVDLIAPGGSMEHDLDGDSFPDAIPAIGFSSSDPSYDAYLIAGTSPAAVQASGVVALLLAHGAEPADVGPLMTKYATPIPPRGFDIFSGAGMVDAKESLRKLHKGHVPEVPKLYVNPILTLATDPDGNRRAIALVELIDEDNEPVPGATLMTHFRGPVTHSSSGVTDERGRAIFVSMAGSPTSDLFEFSVDKVLQCKKHHKKDDSCQQPVITIPGTYAQFEEVSFHFFAAFDPGGVGIDPEPFMIFIPPDKFSPVIADFSLSGTPGAPPAEEPVDVIPADLSSYTLVESLLVRSFGAPGSVGPAVFAVAKSVLLNGCAVADGGITVPSGGVGIDPEPFHVGEDLTGLPPGFDTVLTRSDGGLFLNGQPTTQSELGLLTGTGGSVSIQADGSICIPQARTVNNIGAFATSIQNGIPVSDSGFTFTGSADPNPSPPAPLDLEDTILGRAVGAALFSSANLGGATEASAAVDGIQP